MGSSPANHRADALRTEITISRRLTEASPEPWSHAATLGMPNMTDTHDMPHMTDNLDDDLDAYDMGNLMQNLGTGSAGFKVAQRDLPDRPEEGLCADIWALGDLTATDHATIIVLKDSDLRALGGTTDSVATHVRASFTAILGAGRVNVTAFSGRNGTMLVGVSPSAPADREDYLKAFSILEPNDPRTHERIRIKNANAEALVRYDHRSPSLKRMCICMIGGAARTNELSFTKLLGKAESFDSPEAYAQMASVVMAMNIAEFHMAWAPQILYFAAKAGKYIDAYAPKDVKLAGHPNVELPFATSYHIPGKTKGGYIIAADTSLGKGCDNCVALGLGWPYVNHKPRQLCILREGGAKVTIRACEFVQTRLKDIAPRDPIVRDHHPNPNGVKGFQTVLTEILDDETKGAMIFGFLYPTLLRSRELHSKVFAAQGSSARLASILSVSLVDVDPASNPYEAYITCVGRLTLAEAFSDADAVQILHVIRDIVLATVRGPTGSEQFTILDVNHKVSNTAIDRLRKTIDAHTGARLLTMFPDKTQLTFYREMTRDLTDQFVDIFAATIEVACSHTDSAIRDTENIACAVTQNVLLRKLTSLERDHLKSLKVDEAVYNDPEYLRHYWVSFFPNPNQHPFGSRVPRRRLASGLLLPRPPRCPRQRSTSPRRPHPPHGPALSAPCRPPPTWTPPLPSQTLPKRAEAARSQPKRNTRPSVSPAPAPACEENRTAQLAPIGYYTEPGLMQSAGEGRLPGPPRQLSITPKASLLEPGLGRAPRELLQGTLSYVPVHDGRQHPPDPLVDTIIQTAAVTAKMALQLGTRVSCAGGVLVGELYGRSATWARFVRAHAAWARGSYPGAARGTKMPRGCDLFGLTVNVGRVLASSVPSRRPRWDAIPHTKPVNRRMGHGGHGRAPPGPHTKPMNRPVGHGGHGLAPPGSPTMDTDTYHELQVERFCFIHSVNNAIGRRLIAVDTPEARASVLEKLRVHKESVPSFNLDSGGNLDLGAARFVYDGLTQLDIVDIVDHRRGNAPLSAILQDQDVTAAVLQFMGHAVAIRKRDDHWVWHDSERLTPHLVDDWSFTTQIQGLYAVRPTRAGPVEPRQREPTREGSPINISQTQPKEEELPPMPRLKNMAQTAINRALNAGEAIMMGLGEPTARIVSSRARNAVEAVRLGLGDSAPSAETIHPKPQPRHPTPKERMRNNDSAPPDRGSKDIRSFYARGQPPEQEAEVEVATWDPRHTRTWGPTHAPSPLEGINIGKVVDVITSRFKGGTVLLHAKEPGAALSGLVREVIRDEQGRHTPETAIQKIIEDSMVDPHREEHARAQPQDLTRRHLSSLSEQAINSFFMLQDEAAARAFSEVFERGVNAWSQTMENHNLLASKMNEILGRLNGAATEGDTSHPFPARSGPSTGPTIASFTKNRRRDGTPAEAVDCAPITALERSLDGRKIMIDPPPPLQGSRIQATLHMARNSSPPFTFVVTYDDNTITNELLCRTELQRHAELIEHNGSAAWPTWLNPRFLEVPATSHSRPRPRPFPLPRRYERHKTATVIVWNCQGHRHNLPEVLKLMDMRPDVLILTETWTTRERRLHPAVGVKCNHLGYKQTTSSLPSPRAARGRPKAGVAILVAHSFAHPTSVSPWPESKLGGYLHGVDVDMGDGNPMTICAAYVPQKPEEAALAADIRETIKATATTSGAFIVGGDFNGALHGERPGRKTDNDKLHEAMVVEACLKSYKPDRGRRENTCFANTKTKRGSRIDDLLTSGGASPPHSEEILTLPSTSPHRALRSELKLPEPPRKGSPKPLPKAQAPQTPEYDTDLITPEVEEKLRDHLASDTTFLAKIDDLRKRLNCQDKSSLDETTAAFLQALIDASHRSELPTRRPPPEAWDKTGDTHILTRCEADKRRQLLRAAEDARGWMAEIHASGPEFAPPFPAMPAGTAGTDEVTTYSKAEDVRRDLLKKARDIVSTANNRKAAKVNAKARKTFSRNRKKATRRAMADGPRASLEAITTSDGTVTEDTTEVLREVTRHFRERQTPRPAVPDLLPFQDSPGEHPLDPFVMTVMPPPANPLGERIDENLVTRVLNETPTKRAPGPDGVVGAIVRNLPREARTLISTLFRAYWDERHVPTCLKDSITILLHKKGPATDVSNYRPIALANALFKAFTKTVTVIMEAYVEESGLHPASQNGFRPQRGTRDAVRLVVSALEDAILTASSIHVTYIDYSDAFGSVPHDGLFRVMLAQGFPDDIVEVVRAIYKGVATRVATPHGLTEPIPVGVGTLQGDVLSPALWGVFLAPLLRWLEVGARGYTLKTSDNSVESSAYADDMALLSSSRTESRLQLTKVAQYAEWAGLKVNLSKCAYTALIDGKRTKSPKHAAPLHFTARTGTPLEDGAYVPWLPSDQPYSYLGVDLTATLQWNHDLHNLQEKVNARAAKLLRSPYSIRQRLILLSENIVSGAAYKAVAGGYTPAHTATVDRKVAGHAKRIVRAPHGYAGAFVYLPRDLMGMGVRRFSSIVAETYLQDMCYFLHQPDTPVGAITRGLLQEHLRRGGETGLEGTLRLRKTYASDLPMANALRTLDAFEGGVAGLDVRISSLLGVAGVPDAERNALHTARIFDPIDARLPLRPPAVGKILASCRESLKRLLRRGLAALDAIRPAIRHPAFVRLLEAAPARTDNPTPSTPTTAATVSQAPSEGELEDTNRRTALRRGTRQSKRPPVRGEETLDDVCPHFPPGYQMSMEEVVKQHNDTSYYVRWAPYEATDETNARKVKDWWQPHGYGSTVRATGGPSPQDRTWTVHWDDSLETRAYLLKQPAYAPLLTAFHTAPAPPHERAPDATPGTPDTLPMPTRHAPLARTHAGRLQVLWTSALPHLDLASPPGRYVVRTVGEEARVFSPQGECMATMSKARLTFLLQEYRRTRGPTDSEDEAFAMKAAAAAKYYSSPKFNNLKNLWTTPPPVVGAIVESTGANTERFSSPMNASEHLTRHFSYRKADADFGFQYDAYSVRFTGSYYFNPEYDADELARSLRWAAASARADKGPHMGIGILPRFRAGGYMSMMNTPGIHVLATLSKGFKFLPQDFWKGGEDRSTGTKFEVLIVAVYNQKGLDEYGNGLDTNGPLATYLRANHKMEGEYSPPKRFPTAASQTNVGRSRPITAPVFARDSKIPLLRRPPPNFATARTEENSTSVTPTDMTAPGWEAMGELKWANHVQIYTDGSKLSGGGAGAGVVFMNHKESNYTGARDPPEIRGPVKARIEYPKDATWCTYAFAGVQNAYRAELIAIRQALRCAVPTGTQPVVIFTDSLTAMYNAIKYWERPHMLRYHHELPIIEEIVRLASDLGGGVSLVKVRAHTGVPGNEIADAAAGLAATGSEDITLEDTKSTYPGGAGLACPWSKVPEGNKDGVRRQSADTQEKDGPFHIYNPRRTVRRLMKDAALADILSAGSRLHSTTTLPTNVTRSLGDEPLNEDNPHRPLRQTGGGLWKSLPDNLLRQAVVVRGGWFFAGRLALKAGCAATEFCQICKSRAGGGGWQHTLLNCTHPHMKGMIIKRHDEAVRAIYWALLSSKKGNAQYRVDLKDPTVKVDDEEVDLSEDPEELQEAELHDHAPRALPTDDEQNASRHNRQDERRRTVREDWLKDYTGRLPRHDNPDIIRFEPIPGLKTKFKITIVEVGYCLDDAVAKKIEDKTNKYQELAETLRAAGHKVQGVVVIPLPVRGNIPHSTRASLIALGIDAWVVDRTLSKLHVAACKQMAHLCHRRRQIEAERGISYKPGKHRRRTP